MTARKMNAQTLRNLACVMAQSDTWSGVANNLLRASMTATETVEPFTLKQDDGTVLMIYNSAIWKDAVKIADEKKLYQTTVPQPPPVQAEVKVTYTMKMEEEDIDRLKKLARHLKVKPTALGRQAVLNLLKEYGY